MKLSYRPYQTEDDFWAMRTLLRQSFTLNNHRQINWHVARLDYARWHTCLNCAHVTLNEVATLWETDGELIAFLMPDGGRGEAHLNIHPAYRTAELITEMLNVAEEKLPSAEADGSQKLVVWSPGDDTALQAILARRGYTKGDWPETQHRRRLDAQPHPIPPHQKPTDGEGAGYTIRPLGDGLELLERCYASGLGFHEGDIRVAVDNRNDPTWYRNIQTAPLYRRDLDLVAIGPNGDIAAFCTIWFDDVTRSAYFEPVATVPAHQRRGLGKALMFYGLHRLQKMGATTAFVGGYSPAANALYFSVMGPEHDLSEPWVKIYS